MFKKIAFAHLTISDLLAIRRKVDKATHRADRQQAEKIEPLIKTFLGTVQLPDKEISVFKGDYSAIDPASNGATVRPEDVRPSRVVCVDAAEAREEAKFWTTERLHEARFC